MALYRTKNNTPGYNEKLGIAPGADNSWVKATSDNVLSSISEDLPPVADGTKITMDDISIPSPWAKFVSYEAVLFGGASEYGELYYQALCDWRSLLTLVAMPELIGMNIVFGEDIDIRNPKNPADGMLFKNLLLLKPSNYIFPSDTCWEKLTPVNINCNMTNYEIGMLSSSTLVCPPYKFSAGANTQLATKPFFRNGKFVDPVPYIKANTERAYIMYYWLTELASYFRTKMTVHNESLARVIDLLDKFAADVGAPYQSMPEITVVPPAFALASVRDIFSSMQVNIQVKDEPSPLQLVSAGDKKLILVDSVIMGVSSVSDTADSIKIIGNKTLKQMTGFVSGTKVYAGQAVPEDTEIFIAPDLLLNTITVINCDEKSIVNENADDGVFKLLGKDIIWPVNQKLLDYISAEEIRNNIRIEKTAPNEYAVKLKVKLIAGEWEIVKKYCQDDIVTIAESNVPYVSIWPYIKVTNFDKPEENIWKKYYIYYTYYDKAHCPFEAGPSEQAKFDYKYDLISKDEIVRSSYIYNSLPEYIKMYSSTNSSQYIGVILLPPAKKYLLQNNTEWTVGFDFGTTSTTAFCKNNHGDTKFVSFGDEYKLVKNPSTNIFEQHVVEKGNSGQFIALNPQNFGNDSIRHFLPNAYLKRNAYPSVYEQENSTLGIEAEAFIKGHAMFDYRDKKIQGLQSEIYADLKWSAADNIRASARNYIYQMLMQITFAAAINNVGTINWKFSYPTALSLTLIDGYKATTENIVRKLYEESGIPYKLENGKTYYTESIAAAKHFDNIADTQLVTCVDIGGGSTDISVWKMEGSPVNWLQTSINLASRAIFLPNITGLITRDDSIRKSVVSLDRAVAANLEQNKGIINDDIRRGIEGILFTYEDTVQAIVDNSSGVNKNSFVKAISVGFMSVLYYALSTLAYVKNKFTDERSLTICLSGNGSKIYNWFSASHRQAMVNGLSDYLTEIIGRKINISVKYDKDSLKTEAAQGLLNINSTETECEKNTIVIMGEDATVKYNNGQAVSLTKDDDIFAKEKGIKNFYDKHGKASELNNENDVCEISIDPELKNLRRFVKLCNSVNDLFDDTSMLINYTDEDWTDIHEKVKRDHAREINEGIMSSAFALGVRAILARENKN